MTRIPQGDQERKDAPLYRGLLGYFPAALFEIAKHSLESDRKHNPGSTTGPTWARGKSSDHEDCIVRHLIDAGNVGDEGRRYHLVALAWRALALLQEDCEAAGATPGVSSKSPTDDAFFDRQSALADFKAKSGQKVQEYGVFYYAMGELTRSAQFPLLYTFEEAMAIAQNNTGMVARLIWTT